MPDRISREVVIGAPPDVAWAIVTEPRQVVRSLSDEAEIELRPGGAMLLTWQGHGTYRARVQTVEINELRDYAARLGGSRERS